MNSVCKRIFCLLNGLAAETRGGLTALLIRLSQSGVEMVTPAYDA